ncbi:tRNA (adenosine(37)-N6)-dimethylallyltransferase MiaA [Desulfurobacterium indicum]|uniref:tRNA dimethylallyltransferase n=1 Tax=Desulfurobacterium indicum TaxID=1914305 RepID=A0A1R1MMH6_9BACT|nr:tRNA (adenosine(37)-N6)-dimethylallyltransferase MiaA [Desulfurobacterium indicum]OMH40977.1 tRNA (adenosine(37)-N6)-dimethylallyltransferase MiaA [Desulfurobacterium indicum]
MEREKPLIVITGPTAAGKTDFSIKLAKAIGGEIISADSMQVYRELDIGTDKISSDRMEGIPHHLIDIVYPDVYFSVADFVKEADRAIREIRKRGKFPLIVGGTAFYIRALLYGLSPVPPADESIRRELSKVSTEELYSSLKKVDPGYASKIHKTDRKRIIRALEVYKLTGKPLSSFKLPEKPRYEFYGYFLYRNRDELYKRINNRVDSQIERGLVQEARKLLSYGKGITAFQALGYKELLPYIEGKVSLEEAVRDLKRRTRQFAKRQFTWFRREKGFKWINLSEIPEEEVINVIKDDLRKGGVL